MAKRKHSRKPPQARHGKKSPPSRYDKRARLNEPNPLRRPTTRAETPLVGSMVGVIDSMAYLLDARAGFRISIIIAGALLATGRRTASKWFRAAGVKDDWDRFYDSLKAIGKNAAALAAPLLHRIIERFDPGEQGYWKLAVDDSPTKRFGRHVEAANVHHHPTPGPADGPWLFGHNWVCLAVLATHSLFGVIALPILSQLYVREVDVAKLNQRYGWKFRTKHQLALEMIRRVMAIIRAFGSKARFMVIVDGAYAARCFIKPLVDDGVTVISRLRSDAKIFDIPGNRTGRPGRPCKYGKNRISLANRAARRRGWSEIRYCCRGIMVTAEYNTFEATSKTVGGSIRVVLLKHRSGNWAAYFSTDVTMTAEAILESVSDRWAIEEHFHDVKEVWGAGEQQVRNVWSNIGCWNLCTWLYTLVELECWDQPAAELVDRSDRPWDNPSRRPSHADRRRWIARKMLENQFMNDLPAGPERAKILSHFQSLLALAV